MAKHQKQIRNVCKTCARNTNDAYLCRRCANELHDLLVGSREPDGQPGITWYVKRLRESAYGQTRMARSLSARSSAEGYALLGNKRAAELLDRIGRVLAEWEGIAEALRATHSHETGWEHMGSATRDSERLEVKRARYVAAHVVLIRHHRSDANVLHAAMLDFAREGWRIINRPNDVCCGPCPSIVYDDAGHEIDCATLLYAEEGASSVDCPKCHARHDVELLREAMKAAVRDMLFTRAELVNLMATRLNDPIKQPYFTKLLRDGRLQARRLEQDELPLYTYNDVCAARLKPVPPKRIRKAS